MKRALPFILIGLLIGATLTVVGMNAYANSDLRKMKRCLTIYSIASDETDSDFIKAAKDQGFKTVKELVVSRCEQFVKAGEFDKE